MGAFAITIVVVAGLLFGFGVQSLTNPRAQLGWLLVGIATAVGAFIGSEWLTTNVFDNMAGGPAIDGLVIVPAVIVGLVLGLLTDAFARYIEFAPA